MTDNESTGFEFVHYSCSKHFLNQKDLITPGSCLNSLQNHGLFLIRTVPDEPGGSVPEDVLFFLLNRPPAPTLSGCGDCLFAVSLLAHPAGAQVVYNGNNMFNFLHNTLLQTH